MNRYTVTNKFYRDSAQYRKRDVVMFSEDVAKDLIRQNLIMPFAEVKKKDIEKPSVLPVEPLPQQKLPELKTGKKRGILSLSRTQPSV